jgi:hypothetical protein
MLTDRFGHYLIKRLLNSLPTETCIELIQLVHNEIISEINNSEINYNYFSSQNRSAFVLTAILELFQTKLLNSFDQNKKKDIYSRLNNKQIIQTLESIIKINNKSTPIEGCKVLLKTITSTNTNNNTSTSKTDNSITTTTTTTSSHTEKTSHLRNSHEKQSNKPTITKSIKSKQKK